MTGTAHFTQDTFGNTDDRAGGPFSNFKPQRPFLYSTLQEDSAMRQRINTRFANCLLAIGLSGLAPVAAQAQATSDAGSGKSRMYAWFPAIGGTTVVPQWRAGPSFDVSAEDVIDALKMTFMGQVEARKGKWGVWSDLVYSDMGGSQVAVRATSPSAAAGGRHRRPQPRHQDRRCGRWPASTT